MSFTSSIDLGIPETPVGISNPHDYQQTLLIYNALHALQTAVDGILETPAVSSVHDRAYAFFISGTH